MSDRAAEDNRGEKRKQTPRRSTGGKAPRKMLPSAQKTYFYKVQGGELKEIACQTYESTSDAQTQTSLSGDCKNVTQTKTSEAQTRLTVQNPYAFQDDSE